MDLPRCSGILLHPTCLPGPCGIGDLGSAAYAFVDFLAAAGQSVWQVLPLGPTGYGDSPYSTFSAFAGNPMLVCLQRLVEVGELDPEDLQGVAMAEGEAHYGFVHAFKGRLLHKAAKRFQKTDPAARRDQFEDFCREQSHWLDDFAFFQALRCHFDQRPWHRWPGTARDRDEDALKSHRQQLAAAIGTHKYVQFVFFEQWFALKSYANARGVRIMGDIPIFVAHDSADVWAHRRLFQLDEAGLPTQVAGVPPDYFSKTGQRWGNPLYRWPELAEEDFAWWLRRFDWNLQLADLVRVDHFRGFEACWTIPANEKTAINGNWQAVPGRDLFRALARRRPQPPIIAEDLGVITPPVEALRDEFAFPGMKVLQFAFDGGPGNPYLPHNLTRRCVIYTGTHDNNTTVGWWRGLSRKQRQDVRDYLGCSGNAIAWDLIRAAMASIADLCVFPLQDPLELDGTARMNTPGRTAGNWNWRLHPHALTPELTDRLASWSRRYGRHPASAR